LVGIGKFELNQIKNLRFQFILLKNKIGNRYVSCSERKTGQISVSKANTYIFTRLGKCYRLRSFRCIYICYIKSNWIKIFDSKLNFEVSKISNCYFRSVIRNESKSWFLVSRWIKLKVHIWSMISDWINTFYLLIVIFSTFTLKKTVYVSYF